MNKFTRRAAVAAITLATLTVNGTAFAAEMRVQAPVVDVEPLTEPAMEIEHCDARPGSAATLTAMLAWDLGMNCRTERVASTTVTGYRVFYRWDDRVYSQVMPTAPGPTIALKVRLN